jgi:hypothetical protein
MWSIACAASGCSIYTHNIEVGISPEHVRLTEAVDRTIYSGSMQRFKENH